MLAILAQVRVGRGAATGGDWTQHLVAGGYGQQQYDGSFDGDTNPIQTIDVRPSVYETFGFVHVTGFEATRICE